MHSIKVLDSSSIIKDPNCFSRFTNSNICIPLQVIEELDRIKSRTTESAVMARRFIKDLDSLISNELLAFPGISIDSNNISVVVSNGDEAKTLSQDILSFSIADNQILSCCIYLKNNACESVTLITEDRNLRLKANYLGIDASGLPDIECSKAETSIIEHVPEGIIRELFESSVGIEPGILGITPSINDYFILRNCSTSALVKYNGTTLVRVRKRDSYGVVSRNAEQSFAIDALMDTTISLVALTGKAGTGKTLLALATALEQRGLYKQILLARPVVPLGKDLGALPGDIEEKLKPYMQPLFDNLSVIKQGFKDNSEQQHLIGKLIEQEKLVIEPLTYIRGRSISKVFLIVDEAQNLTQREIKTIVTRAGEGTKIVFTGDTQQIDTCGLDQETNGLSYMISKMKGQKLFNHVKLNKTERSELAELAAELL